MLLRSTNLDAVIAGYLGVDLAPGFAARRKVQGLGELLRPGKLIETSGLTISLGGAVANTGLAMKRFGRRVALAGCVGDDLLGRMATRLLHEQGVTRGIRRIARSGTAYGIVVAPPGQNRLFLEDAGCNRDFSAADLDYTVIRRSRLFHFGYPPLLRRFWMHRGEELRLMLGRVRRLGVATSLDLSLPDPDSAAGRVDWADLLARVLPSVDIFVPSIEEILFMLERRTFNRLQRDRTEREIAAAVPTATFVRLADRLEAMGVKVLMIKAADRGAYLRTGEVSALRAALGAGFPAANWSHRELWVPACRVARRRVRNSSGAGDCAVAGFLSALLAGCSIERAAGYAMIAGRDNLYGPDALSGLRRWPEMSRCLRRHPPDIEEVRRRVRAPVSGRAKR